MKELAKIFEEGQMTTKKRKLIVSPYSIEDVGNRPSLVFPYSPNFNMKSKNKAEPPGVELPINPDLLSYELDYNPFK